MNAQDITDALFLHFNSDKGYKYQLCNSYVFRWESDFFCIARSGMVYEIEVKVSRSDFRADFNKKRKHRLLKHEGEYFVDRNFVPFGPDNLPDNKINPHWPPQSRIGIRRCSKLRPNKFLYAVPEGLIDKKEVPKYAGLIYVNEHHEPTIVKRPPVLQKDKADLTKVLLEKYYWAYLRMLDQTRAGKNFQLVGEES